jgi:acyl phosphate:glycerol-3-phosphate acyltransferase
MNMITDITLILAAYLLGSLASAIIVCKLMGRGDPRLDGSGNPGATNVLRLHGKKAGIYALLGDLLKGVVPVLVARYLDSSDGVIALTGLAAFIGHLFPVFFGFKGGKGVATLLGVLVAIHWLLGLLFALTWITVAKLSRYSSLAGILSAILAPGFAWLVLPDPAYTVCTLIMSALLLWRHRPNILKLLAGTESRIGSGKS